MQKKPQDVFTPKSHKINRSMYVNRNDIESRIKDALSLDKFIFLHGESGNGKTWLYKKVLEDCGVHYEVLNLSLVGLSGSISSAISAKLGEFGESQKEREGSTSAATLKAFGSGVEHNLDKTYEYYRMHPLSSLMKSIRKRAGNDKRSALIFDNFESIVDSSDMMKELAGLILSSDDESFADHNVQVIIVGVPNSLKDAFASLFKETPSQVGPVVNRIIELPEVCRMNDAEVKYLVHKGFCNELELSFSADMQEQDVIEYISWVTDNIVQHVQEICLHIALEARKHNRGLIDKTIIAKAEKRWADETISGDINRIIENMNSRNTKIGRKNQILYILGQVRSEKFNSNHIDTLFRSQFPGDNHVKSKAVLTELSRSENPIIKREGTLDIWRFVSPKHRMAIRNCLNRGDDKVVRLKSTL